MSKIINVSGHPVDIDSGRTLAPGETADGVDLEHPHNKALVDDGLAVEVADEKKPKAQPTTGEDNKS